MDQKCINSEGQFFDGLYYIVVGSGPPIIALHGFCETSYTWRYLVDRLRHHFTFHLFDLKGHGKSEKPDDGRYSIDDQAALIRQYISERKLNDVTILGHSMGGGIALLLALRCVAEHDNCLRSLILIDSIGIPQEIPLFIRLVSMRWLLKSALRLFSPQFLVRRILARAFADKTKITNDSVVAYAANLSNEKAVNALSTTAKQLISANASSDFTISRYHLIGWPTLILWGIADNFVRPHVGIFLNTQIAVSKWIPIERCGHAPEEEMPDVVAREIRQFMAEYCPTARE